MNSRRSVLFAAVAALFGTARAQAPATPPKRFAVEFRTGPKWDANKTPDQQAHFREHSANLSQLRKQGRILVGARYSDKGLLIFSGESEAEIRALIEVDPAVQNQIFSFEVHEFRVFYTGCL